MFWTLPLLWLKRHYHMQKNRIRIHPFSNFTTDMHVLTERRYEVSSSLAQNDTAITRTDHCLLFLHFDLFLTMIVFSLTWTSTLLSGKCLNSKVFFLKPFPRTRWKMDVLPTPLFPHKATLYTSSFSPPPSAISRFSSENLVTLDYENDRYSLRSV